VERHMGFAWPMMVSTMVSLVVLVIGVSSRTGDQGEDSDV
jgi:hypothetical protein